MWSFEHSVETTASPAAIWKLYSDVTTWPVWDSGISAIELDGPFAAGSTGTITPMGQDALRFRIVSATPGKGFSDETEIPGTGVVIRFIHTLNETPSGKTKVAHRVEIDGSSADTLGPQIGPSMTVGIPETMDSLVRHALNVGV